MIRTEKVCGTCKWHKHEQLNDWSCDNHDGEYFGDYTEYSDSCPDYEERGTE